MEILIEKQPDNHVFNVGNGDTVTVREWAELCYRIVGKESAFVSVDKSIPQRNYFCFYDYEYVLDVSKQNELMSDTVPLERGMKEEFEWYINNNDSIINRKPYFDFIDSKLL
jgi:dTDP-glucose 4,6-dehydratase